MQEWQRRSGRRVKGCQPHAGVPATSRCGGASRVREGGGGHTSNTESDTRLPQLSTAWSSRSPAARMTGLDVTRHAAASSSTTHRSTKLLGQRAMPALPAVISKQSSAAGVPLHARPCRWAGAGQRTQQAPQATLALRRPHKCERGGRAGLQLNGQLVLCQQGGLPRPGLVPAGHSRRGHSRGKASLRAHLPPQPGAPLRPARPQKAAAAPPRPPPRPAPDNQLHRPGQASQLQRHQVDGAARLRVVPLHAPQLELHGQARRL